MEVSNLHIQEPFFSICIPQFNRTLHLIESCKILAAQTFQLFEVCISDDQSTDGREEDLISYLQNSGLSFIYKKQEKNLGYDGNIRASIDLAQGKYCLLLGNDDCLKCDKTLEDLYHRMQEHKTLGVVITNYEDWTTGDKNWRVRKTKLVGSGPIVAVGHFRNLSFVSGIIIQRTEAQIHRTEKWDGSEMYQMFIVARILASGFSLLELSDSVARKDIHVPNEIVDSYARRAKLHPCPVIERKLPMSYIGPLIADAIEPYLNDGNRRPVIEKIVLQLYVFTYPYWIIEYRRVQSWRYALGVCLGIKPKNVFTKLDLGLARNLKLTLLYIVICLLGLSVPVQMFSKLQPLLYTISKRAIVASSQIK